MKAIMGLEGQRFKRNNIVTLGVFDGVHLGHQKIIKKAVDEAKRQGNQSLAMTFDPHPLEIIGRRKRPPLLTDLEIKTELIRSLGIDILLIACFDTAFAKITASDFIVNILADQLQAVCVVVGEEYRFGHQGLGDLAMLTEQAARSGFKVISIPLQKYKGEVISSTRIRSALEKGDLDDAIAMLGHYPILAGRVITGLHHGGQILSHPTANLKLEDDLVVPKPGVYACYADLQGERKAAVANIGYSPTFKVKKLRIEVHILDMDANILGQRVEIRLIRRLREERCFPHPEKLARQIRQDIDQVRQTMDDEEKRARRLWL